MVDFEPHRSSQAEINIGSTYATRMRIVLLDVDSKSSGNLRKDRKHSKPTRMFGNNTLMVNKWLIYIWITIDSAPLKVQSTNA